MSVYQVRALSYLLPGGNRRKQTDSRFARKAKANTFCICFGWQILTVHRRILQKHQSSFPILSVVTRVGLYLGMSATSVPVPVECVFSRHTTGIISNGKRSSIGPAKLNLGFVQFSGKGPPVCGVTSFYNYWYAVILPVIVCHAKWLRRRQVGLREKRKSYDLKFKLLVEKAGGSGRLYG